MNNGVVKEYDKYKQTKENGVGNKERYKLLIDFAQTNPADVNKFSSLRKGKKDLNQKRNKGHS